MVISSPIIILSNPVSAAALSYSTDGNPSAPSTIGQDGSDFTTQAPLSGVSARQTNNIVGAQSYYDFVFTTSTTGTIKFIDITFPAGTVIGSSPLLVKREGTGAGTAAKTSATVIRHTVTNAVSVPAGTEIRLEFFNIVNPTLPNTGYEVTITTRDAAGTAIDGPTPSNSLKMKQIGTGQIADNAITTPKIADGAITSFKITDGAVTQVEPADDFVKQVLIRDTPNGHAVGWDPNGVATVFEIPEAARHIDSNVVVNVDSTVSADPICSASGPAGK